MALPKFRIKLDKTIKYYEDLNTTERLIFLKVVKIFYITWTK